MTDVLKDWNRFSRRLHPHTDVIWLFDFDGTLARIVSHPAVAKIDPVIRRLLGRLARRFPNRVGVISGRALSDVRRRVRVPRLVYGGSHGQEISGPTWRLHRTPPKSLGAAFERFGQIVEPCLKTAPGMWIEKKPWSRCLHYRQTRRSDAGRVRTILKEITTLAQRLGLRTQSGARSVEILPRLSWDKGAAVEWLKRRLKAKKVFYIGDDTTDESVFRRYRPPHAMVVVGLIRNSRATYSLKSQTQVRRLLERLTSL